MKIAPIKVELIDYMGSDLTKTQQRILEAVERGYRIENGVVFSPKNKLSVKCRGAQRYPTFGTNWGGVCFGVPAHLFAAYWYYGVAAFKKGVVVRHMNGNTNDFSESNIRLGSHSENNMDKAESVRVAAARSARKAQGITPANAKLSVEQVQMVRDVYKSLAGKKAPNGVISAIADKLGVSRTVLFKIKNGEYYAHV